MISPPRKLNMKRKYGKLIDFDIKKLKILYLVRPISRRRISYHLQLTRNLRDLENHNVSQYEQIFLGSAVCWGFINVVQLIVGFGAGDNLGLIFLMGHLVMISLVASLVGVIIALVICYPGRWLTQKLRRLVN